MTVVKAQIVQNHACEDNGCDHLELAFEWPLENSPTGTEAAKGTFNSDPERTLEEVEVVFCLGELSPRHRRDQLIRNRVRIVSHAKVTELNVSILEHPGYMCYSSTTWLKKS